MNENKISNASVISLVVVIILLVGGYYWWSSGDKVIPETKSTGQGTESGGELTTENIKNLMHKITIETNKGKIVFETYDVDAPKAVKNFVDLAKK